MSNQENKKELASGSKGIEQVAQHPLPLPYGVDHMDYLILREYIYDWFKSRRTSIRNADRVLDCLKSDLVEQKCSGLTVQNE